MDDIHRNVIQSNYVSLVEQTDLDLMVSALYEKGVFSDHMIEKFKDQRHDVRHRKRELYMDVMTRGPDAFGHLIDALTEAGYWNLARDLDPDSHLHANNPFGNRRTQPATSNEEYISLRNGKNKTNRKTEPQTKEPTPPPIMDSENNPFPDTVTEIPRFNIKKCTRFFEDTDHERGIKVYRTRGRQRGVLVVFSYTEFLNNIEEPRPGVDVDNAKLKYLFNELGFKVLFYNNLAKSTLVSTLKSLNEVLEGVECVFIVVSSHGYERARSTDNDFRCYDGGLMPISDFLEYFNNRNMSKLQGVPKVFIFQICRGSTVDWKSMPCPEGAFADAGVDRAPARAPAPGPAAGDSRDRLYSDILIAHSTLPGLVSWRDPDKGSWYVQALVHVFAAHAHDTHVEELFTLVDKRLQEQHAVQTSSVDRWGFNSRLYLHPGLYE